MSTPQDLKFAMEEHIDTHGVESLLSLIQEITFEKGQHILTNCPDDYALVLAWRRLGDYLDRVCCAKAVRNCPLA